MEQQAELKRIRKIEEDLRTLSYMLGNGFEPKATVFVNLLRDIAAVNIGPPLTRMAFKHLAERLEKKRGGRPRTQLSFDEYDKLWRAKILARDLAARIKKKRAGKRVRGRESPTAEANSIVATRLRMKPKTFEAYLAKLNRDTPKRSKRRKRTG